MSLDGYIAGPNGEYDWIEMDPAFDAAAFFKAYYAQFDIAVMGRKSFEPFGGPVEGMRTFVFSRTLKPSDRKDVTIVGDDGVALLKKLREEDGKDIWLFGGGELFGSLSAQGLVDLVEVSIVPVILGSGRPLMSGNPNRVKLKLISTDVSPGGFITLKYEIPR